ncbi:MAG: CHAT domain-containing protein [Myxococcota bacterium]
MDSEYFSLSLSIHRVGDSFAVELAHRDPTSEAQVAPARGIARFELAELADLERREAEYGQALARQLLADESLEQRFLQVEAAAQAAALGLRVSLRIDPSAQELQALRWELLRHPQTGARLTTSERLLLSRFMVSRDWRPIRLRARAKLRALVVVSAPTRSPRLELAPVDWQAEVGAVQEALGATGAAGGESGESGEGIEVSVLGGPDAPVTLDALVDALRTGVDIVYLVSHGMFGRRTGSPALVLQDEAGEAAVVKGEALTERVGELPWPPRLLVLASCQSAGDGGQLPPGQRTSPQATLAGRLADAGVPAVVAMQGAISMGTAREMMPTFFAELMRDGRIDRALAVARGKVRERPDFWMPALFTRLLGGRLWYEAGFAATVGEEVWRRLVKPVHNGRVVPIIGPRLLEGIHGGVHDIAMRLAGQHRFPMQTHHRDDLPRVAEYMRVKESRYNVIQAYRDQLLHNLIEQHGRWLPAGELPPVASRPKLGKLLAMVGDRRREHDPHDPHRLLAELPASFYVTTTFDPLLERALRANDRPPQQVLTRWRYQSKPLSADDAPVIPPTAKEPLVYHAFGAFGAGPDDGLVMTEDDYFDYLLQANVFRLFPREVESALVDNSLLFLGFRLTDWHFRVLFRLMMSLPGRERLKQYCHVAVQLDPDMQEMSDVEGAKRYLAEYFGQEANIDIFWGSSAEFLRALHEQLAGMEVPPHSEDGEGRDGEDGDEWAF